MLTTQIYRFKSKIENISPVQKKVMDIAAKMDFHEDALYCLRLALDEAIANAIVHGNCLDDSKNVKVTVIPQTDKMVVSVCDDGCGFDQSKLPDPREEVNLQKPNGRGIFLIREFSHEVTFNDKGNQINFTIHRQTTCPMLQSTKKL